MQLAGHLRKMPVELASPVHYSLRLDDKETSLQHYLDHHITVRFTGEIACVQCGRLTKKSFQQGYCFPCMRRINECGNCQLHPERCKVEEGGCPSDDWAHVQCASAHVVYLANSSGLKVGITRVQNVPSRWIDQGAIAAVPIIRTSNRYQAGLVEVLLKQHVNDKTNWRAMLKNQVTEIDLLAEKHRLLALAARELAHALGQYDDGVIEVLKDEAPTEIHYPVLAYPEKITSLSLDKTPEVSGRLQGIKGQYLILDTGVMNVRKFGGYNVEVMIDA